MLPSFFHTSFEVLVPTILGKIATDEDRHWRSCNPAVVSGACIVLSSSKNQSSHSNPVPSQNLSDLSLHTYLHYLHFY